MGRPKMIFDWEAKKDVCYDLYITQKKSLDDVIAHFETPDFTPSKRAFQAQFKLWKFPRKHVPGPKDQNLTERVRQLWEVNTSNKQMVVVLESEGFEITERQLSKLRRQHNLMMRESNCNRSATASDTKRGRENDVFVESENRNGLGNSASPVALAGQKRPRGPSPGPDLAPEVINKRQARIAQLMAESEERLKNKTRRRRTKSWAGLPADEGLPPRFPSELTMEESMRELDLDKTQYKHIRDVFTEICEANNVIMKTISGPERWKAALDELISHFPNLQQIFWGPDALYLNQTQKPMALDLICMDVTKRIRTNEKRVTIGEAKSILGLTPQETRDIRAAFDAILKADNFTSKLEATKEHWDGLKAKWINGSTRLRVAVSQGEADLSYPRKMNSIETIARDVQKRHRDSQTKHSSRLLASEPSITISPSVSPNSAPPARTTVTDKARAPPKTAPSHPRPRSKKHDAALRNGLNLINAVSDYGINNQINTASPSTNGITTLASQALASAPSYSTADYAGMQIDPTLLEAASRPQSQEDYYQQLKLAQQHSLSKPIYFRLSPGSIHKYPTAPKIWLDTLHGQYRVDILRELALKKSGLDGQAQVAKIEGLAGEGERWDIDEDDELEAYLGHVGGGKATFIVEMV